MLDSDSWKEFAEKFRVIQSLSRTPLFLEWQRTYGARSGLTSKILHDANHGRRLYLEFMLLAHEGGIGSDKESRDPVRTWIELIIERDVANNPHSQRDPIGPESTPAGEIWHQPGRIHDLCGASVNLCLELALAARESERTPSSRTPHLQPPEPRHEPEQSELIADERQRLIREYKNLCKKAGVNVTDAMIAKAAAPTWNDRTQVTWWKRNDSHSKPAADKLIRAVFTAKPHLPRK